MPNTENTERNCFNVINGRDPCTTVYYMGFNPQLIGQLYIRPIKDLLKPCANASDIQVAFDSGAAKVYVTFRQNHDVVTGKRDDLLESLPGNVLTEVYKAVKMRKVQGNPELRVLS